jgi:hypothetical protein
MLTLLNFNTELEFPTLWGIFSSLISNRVLGCSFSQFPRCKLSSSCMRLTRRPSEATEAMRRILAPRVGSTAPAGSVLDLQTLSSMTILLTAYCFFCFFFLLRPLHRTQIVCLVSTSVLTLHKSRMSYTGHSSSLFSVLRSQDLRHCSVSTASFAPGG